MSDKRQKARQLTEAFILQQLEAMVPGGPTTELYKTYFAGLSDVAFEQFIQRLERGEQFLTLTMPNFGASPKLERNLALAEKLGHSFFQRLWIGAHDGIPTHLTPVPVLVVDLPLRRASQMLVKKLSVQESDKTHDILSGQPTGEARRGAKISFPELQVLTAMGLDKTVVELFKFRGGDTKGRRALNAMINRNGGANLETLKHYAGGVESTRTVSTFLKAMHLANTL